MYFFVKVPPNFSLSLLLFISIIALFVGGPQGTGKVNVKYAVIHNAKCCINIDCQRKGLGGGGGEESILKVAFSDVYLCIFNSQWFLPEVINGKNIKKIKFPLFKMMLVRNPKQYYLCNTICLSGHNGQITFGFTGGSTDFQWTVVPVRFSKLFLTAVSQYLTFICVLHSVFLEDCNYMGCTDIYSSVSSWDRMFWIDKMLSL